MSEKEKNLLGFLKSEFENQKENGFKAIRFEGLNNRIIDKETVVQLKFNQLVDLYEKNPQKFKVEKMIFEIKNQKYIASLNTFFEGIYIPKETIVKNDFKEALALKKENAKQSVLDAAKYL